MSIKDLFLGDVQSVYPVEGTEYFVRIMSGRASDKFSTLVDGKAANSLIMATLIRYAVCDASGELVFGDDDIEKLRDAGLPELKRAFDAAMKVNAVGKDEVDGLEKN